MYRFFPYVYLSMISFSVLISLALYSLKYRHNHGAKELMLAVIGMAWWVFCQAFELMALTFPVKLFWANIEYLGILAGLAYLMAAFRFAGMDHLVNRRNVLLGLSIYAFFYILLFTDQYHGLMRTNFSLDTSAVPYTIHKNYGTLYPLYLLWAFGINIVAALIILNSVRNKSSIYKRQSYALVFFISVISVTNLMYIMGLSPVKRFDITPAITWIPALGLAWGVFRNKLLDITPIARDTVIEQLSSGVLVVDAIGKIIDYNNAALQLLNVDGPSPMGKNYEKAISLPLIHTLTTKNASLISDEDHGRVLEVVSHPFGSMASDRLGTIFVISDVTEREQHMKEMVKQQRAMSVIEEREKFGRDLHDSIGQMFGYVNTQTQAIKENILREKYNVALFQTEALIEETQKVHGDIRNYILEMRGISPRNRSFTAAIKQYAVTFRKNYNIPIQVMIDESLPADFPETHVGIQLLRIVQESLNNVQKHAGKCQVTMNLKLVEAGVKLTVKDTGVGFDVNQAAAEAYGITIMKERTAEIGGKISIQTAKNRGTEISVLVPLKAMVKVGEK